MISGSSQEDSAQKNKDKNTMEFFSILAKNRFPNTKQMARLFHLIKNKININARDENGYTPLHRCVIRNNLELIQQLIQLGADPNTIDNDHRGTPLHSAAHFGYTEVVEILFNAGAEINALNDDNETPLHIALEYSNTEIAQLLLRLGAKANIKDIFGNIALHKAAHHYHIEIIRFLLANNFDIGVKNGAGNTPLHLAFMRHSKVAQFLLENGADINIVNNSGYSPLKNAFLIHYNQFEGTAALRLITNNLLILINKCIEAGWERFDILRNELGDDFALANSSGEIVSKILAQDQTRIIEIIGIIEAQYNNAAKMAPASLMTRLLKVLACPPVEECAASSSSQVCIDDEHSVIRIYSARKPEKRERHEETEECGEEPKRSRASR